MKIASKIILLAALAGLGVWLWFILFPAPEKIIRHRLAKLAQTVSFSQKQGNFSRLASGESVSGFFSTNAEVTVNIPDHEPQTLAGRAEITQFALLARERVAGLSVKFSGLTVAVAPDKQSATADLTALANVAGEEEPMVQELKFTFEKTEGQWLIKKVETVRTLL